jgi:hypothetical protein
MSNTDTVNTIVAIIVGSLAVGLILAALVLSWYTFMAFVGFIWSGLGHAVSRFKSSGSAQEFQPPNRTPPIHTRRSDTARSGQSPLPTWARCGWCNRSNDQLILVGMKLEACSTQGCDGVYCTECRTLQHSCPGGCRRAIRQRSFHPIA